MGHVAIATYYFDVFDSKGTESKNKLGFHYQRNASFLTDRLNQAAFSAVIKSISYRMWYPLGYDQKSSVMTEKLRIFT